MSSFWKKTIFLLTAAAMAFSLVGCQALSLTEEERSELESEEPEVVIGQSIGQELAPTYAADQIFSLNSVSSSSFNPYTTSSAWNRVVGMLVYESLVEMDESFSAQPNLITSWETEDGKRWVFHVDRERRFHSGGSMTAADAVYSLELAMNYDASPYKNRFRNVIGEGTLDDGSFEVTLSEANYSFYQLMNIPCVEYGTGFDSRPSGTGPYCFSASGRYLTRFAEHPLASELSLETIHLKEYTAAVDILQAFEDSYIDLVINDPNSISSLGYSSTNLIKFVNTSSMHYLGYNMSSAMFSQSLFRLMMTYLIDRDTIVSSVMGGAAVAATVPVSPVSSLYPTKLADTLAYSESTLETALQNIGAQDVDGDGVLEIGGRAYTIDFIVCSESGTKVSVARTIAKKLENIGFAVNLRELDYEDYLTALKKGNFDIYYAEVRLCADWDLRLLLEMDQSLNYGGVRDATLDSMMSAVLASSGEDARQKAEELYTYIGQNAYITPICFERTEVLFHRGVLTGLNPTQDNVFYGMENWSINLNETEDGT